MNRAELVLYNEYGDTYNIPLSETQLKAAVTVLGITETTKNTVTCYSDDTLNQILQKGRFPTSYAKTHTD